MEDFSALKTHWEDPLLESLDLCRLRTLGALLHVELDGFTLGEGLVTLELDRADVAEHIWTTLRGEESKTFSVVEPCDSTCELRHDPLSVQATTERYTLHNAARQKSRVVAFEGLTCKRASTFTRTQTRSNLPFAHTEGMFAHRLRAAVQAEGRQVARGVPDTFCSVRSVSSLTSSAYDSLMLIGYEN